MRITHLTLIAFAATLTIALTGCGDTAETSRQAAGIEATDEAEATPSDDAEAVGDTAPTENPEPTEEIDPTEPLESDPIVIDETPEAIEDPAPTEPNTPQPTPTSDELFGTKLCVQNNASKAVTIVSGLGQSSPFDIEPGAQQCSDNFNPLDAKDVKGLLAVNGGELMYVAALNPYVGLASVMLGQPTGYMCTNDNLGRQGMKSTAKDDGVLRYQFERLTPFSLKPQRIEFRLDLSDSKNPSSSGTPRRCA